jgi:uncharacterized protein
VRLVEKLGLQPHPEGGYYRQVYKSSAVVGDRAAITAIYFLLERGQISRWHRVLSDELWTFLEGAPLTLWMHDGASTTSLTLDTDSRIVAVPRTVWQAAETTGDYTLVACFVAPGFEFADFVMMLDVPEAQGTVPAELRRLI